MHAAPARLVCLSIVLVCLAAIPGLLTGCGSEGPHLPDVTAGVTVGPTSGAATITVKSSGSGAGVAAIVLTYPDGHRRPVGQGVLEGGTDLGYSRGDYPPGRYTYTIYAVATPSVPEAPTTARRRASGQEHHRLRDVRHRLTGGTPPAAARFVYSRRHTARRDDRRCTWAGWRGSIDVGQEYHKPLVTWRMTLFLDIGATARQVDQVLGAAGARQRHRRRRRDRQLHAGGDRRDDHRAAGHADLRAGARRPSSASATSSAARCCCSIGGIAANILIGVLIGLVTVNRMPLDLNPQVVGRTSPTLLDLGVAVATGIAGSFALSRKDVSDILAGVAIAISLVPVLAVVGITLGSGRTDLALGAFVLFLTNAAAILVAGAIVFTAAGYRREAEPARRPLRAPRHHRHRRPRRRPPGPAAAPRRAHPVLRALDQRRPGGGRGLGRRHRVARRLGHESGDEIVINVIGPGASPGIASLKAAIRRDVPVSIPVKVIEESGSTTPL